MCHWHIAAIMGVEGSGRKHPLLLCSAPALAESVPRAACWASSLAARCGPSAPAAATVSVQLSPLRMQGACLARDAAHMATAVWCLSWWSAGNRGRCACLRPLWQPLGPFRCHIFAVTHARQAHACAPREMQEPEPAANAFAVSAATGTCAVEGRAAPAQRRMPAPQGQARCLSLIHISEPTRPY